MLTAITTWLRAQPRGIRCILLVSCSPLLIPFLCAAFPFLWAAEACFRLCCKKRRGKQAKDDGDNSSCRLLQCEEGRCKEKEEGEDDRRESEREREEEGEVGSGSGSGSGSLSLSLLQRYLEDQLKLAGSVYECGDDDDDYDYDNTPSLLS